MTGGPSNLLTAPRPQPPLHPRAHRASLLPVDRRAPWSSLVLLPSFSNPLLLLLLCSSFLPSYPPPLLPSSPTPLSPSSGRFPSPIFFLPSPACFPTPPPVLPRCGRVLRHRPRCRVRHSAPRAVRSHSNNPAQAAESRRGSLLRSSWISPGCPLVRCQAAGQPGRPKRPRMKWCAFPAGALLRRRARGARGSGALQGPGCAALWVLLLAQVGVQVSPRQRGRGSPRLPWLSHQSHRGVAAVFQKAPACASGPSAASAGSPSVRRPPSPTEWSAWVEKGGKSASRFLILAM